MRVVGASRDDVVGVCATVETEGVPSAGDAADDICVWVHPEERSRSVIVATDKDAGLAVFGLDGRMIHYYRGGEPNNVDIRHAVPLGGVSVDIVAAGDRADNTIAVYRVDAESRGLVPVAARPIVVGIEVYGFCLYREWETGTLFAFVNSNKGEVEQWVLRDDGTGHVVGELARSFGVSSQTEGCVADDELGRFYLSEEALGIWRFPAASGGGEEGVCIDRVRPDGRLVPDIEGLTIYLGNGGTGYLIASSQSDGGETDAPVNRYAVYRREGENEYLGSFRIVAGDSIDEVTVTDGIDVVSCSLGPQFPKGVFIAQDDQNPGGNQNFKLVSWGEIASKMELTFAGDSQWEPRALPGGSRKSKDSRGRQGFCEV